MPEEIDPERLSDLIGLIYDCAIDPARWPIAMEAIRGEMGLQLSSLDVAGLPEGHSLLNYMTNVPDPWAQRADLMPRAAEMWGGMANLLANPFEEPMVLSRVVGEPDESWTMPFYREWAEPQGISDVICLPLVRDERGLGAVSFGRHRDAAPIDERMIELGRLLIPHLQRAAAINRLLDLAAHRQATFTALFDAMRAPVLVVDEGLSVEHANSAARTLIARDDVLHLRNGVLSAADRTVQQALSAAIHDATEDFIAFGRRGLGIPLPRGEDASGMLHLLPLRPDPEGGRRRAALFVAETRSPPAANETLAAILFGLTPGESAVFAQIADGIDVSHAAKALGVAPSTVKTHLQHIYDKTGVRRQAELVRLAHSLAGPASR
jgi:DNA-binding CsgD family transcriptional regulator